MSSEKSKGEETDSTRESLEEGPAHDTIELRLPAKADYLPVLRATVGVIAGTMSFDYDKIT